MTLQLSHLPQRIRNILSDTKRHVTEAQLFITASSLAYTTILSIIPLIALSFVIFKAFGGIHKVYNILEPLILSNLAEGASDKVIIRLKTFIDHLHVSTIGLGGFLGLVFTSTCMLMSIENAFNRVWRVRNTRTWFRRISTYWLFITLGPLALSIALGIVTSSSLRLTHILPGNIGIFCLTTSLLFFVYKLVPNTCVKWQYALIAGFWTAVLWNLSRLGYHLYIEKFASYNKIYGSLAAIPILLIWIYLQWLLILSGAALTSALQRRLEQPANSLE